MTSKNKSKRGRPKVDSERVDTRFERPVLTALDAFVADETDKPSRPEAIRRLLRKQLIAHGYLKDEPDT